MEVFNIGNIFFTLFDYQVSYLEFFGMISGLVAIFLASRANILSWPVGLVNVSLSFFLFYQVQLYPDMFLQIFFFVTNIIGWWRWLHPKPGEEDRKRELRVSYLSPGERFALIVTGTTGTFVAGKFASGLHRLSPVIFNKPSAYPYMDSFIMVMSIITTFYMIRKKIESWIIWILVDVVAFYLYYLRGILLYSLLYFIFCFIAAYGLYHWQKEWRSYNV